MFERFTARAREVVVLARDEAHGLKHNYIGTEHLLLGILREEEGLGARVLKSLGVSVERTRTQVVEILGMGNEVTTDQSPFTPRAKKVLSLGEMEADALDEAQIATHHLLLGLLREGEGVANRVLLDSTVEPKRLRNLILAGLEAAPAEVPARVASSRFSVLRRPGEGSAGDPSERQTALGVCSFCGQMAPHMFSSHPPRANDPWICGECLDLFHDMLLRQRAEAGPRP